MQPYAPHFSQLAIPLLPYFSPPLSLSTLILILFPPIVSLPSLHHPPLFLQNSSSLFSSFFNPHSSSLLSIHVLTVLSFAKIIRVFLVGLSIDIWAKEEGGGVQAQAQAQKGTPIFVVLLGEEGLFFHGYKMMKEDGLSQIHTGTWGALCSSHRLRCSCMSPGCLFSSFPSI